MSRFLKTLGYIVPFRKAAKTPCSAASTHLTFLVLEKLENRCLLDWSGWYEVPGNGTTDVGLGSVEFGGQVYLFGKGINDQRIYVNTTADGSSWSGWNEVPGGGTTNATLDPVVFNNQLYVFSKGIVDQRIYVNTTADGSSWSGWNEVPGDGTTDVALGSAVFGGQLYLFGKGINDRRIYVNTTADGSSWSGWNEVPGGGTTDVALGSAVFGPLYLFGKGINDQRIYLNTTTDGITWSGWSEVPGDGTTDTALSAVTFDSTYQLFLFSKGINDQRIYANFVSVSPDSHATSRYRADLAIVSALVGGEQSSGQVISWDQCDPELIPAGAPRNESASFGSQRAWYAVASTAPTIRECAPGEPLHSRSIGPGRNAVDFSDGELLPLVALLELANLG